MASFKRECNNSTGYLLYKFAESELMSKPHIKNVSHSIRTHFGILTSGIFLSLLLVFYLGGRYILINIIRQAEKEITTVSNDIKTIMVRHSSSLQEYTIHTADACASISPGRQLSLFLKQLINPRRQGLQTHMAALLNLDGSLREGYYLEKENTPEQITSEMLFYYFNQQTGLDTMEKKKLMPVTGMINFLKVPYYISISPVYNAKKEVESFLCVGSPVDGNLLFKKMSEISHGLNISMNEKLALKELQHVNGEKTARLPAPIFEEDELFASGSQWHIGDNEFETVIPIYDILGNKISSLSIRFPRSFTGLTTIALGWLTVFVAVVGMIFIAPVFWLQSRVILDPLSKLEQQIRSIGEKHKDNRIEYLNYTSNDEFGHVARSVDALLQELNIKSHKILINAQRQKALIAGMPDCLCIFSRSAKLTSMEKPSDIVAPIPGLEINKELSPEFFKGESILLFKKALKESVKTGRVISASLICRESNNILRYFETRIVRMDEHFVLVVFRDVTKDFLNRRKQEKIEARAGKTQQMATLGNFASGIAHDFNNILTIIKNTLEVQFCAKGTCGQKEEEAITAIKEASSRGSDLVQELMTYAGQTNINMKRKSPSDIITKLTPLCKGVVHPSVNLEISHGQDLHDVMIDSGQFWKVIVNLVKNAAESIKSNRGYIKISTFNYDLTKTNALKFLSSHPLEPDRGVIFEVADNGAGIPQDIIDRLFEPFFSTKAVSRGLGLATVFGIVDSHSGGIAIISHENIGTKFRVWLPAAEEVRNTNDIEELVEDPDSDEPVTKGTLISATRLDSSKPCVLIIDDDPSIIKTTALLLSCMGIETLTAKSRTEAVARFRKYENRVDLVMMDAQIGNLDSVRLLATLRMSREKMPVVICSGHSKEKIEKMFSGSRIDGILIKPYTMSELEKILSKFLILKKQ